MKKFCYNFEFTLLYRFGRAFNIDVYLACDLILMNVFLIRYNAIIKYEKDKSKIKCAYMLKATFLNAPNQSFNNSMIRKYHEHKYIFDTFKRNQNVLRK